MLCNKYDINLNTKGLIKLYFDIIKVYRITKIIIKSIASITKKSQGYELISYIDVEICKYYRK